MSQSRNAEFLRGATAVLAHMETAGEGCSTLYNEVVQFIGAASLIRQARRDGAMRWSGLSSYLRSKNAHRLAAPGSPAQDQP
jgi:hypothetical protein